MINKSQKSESQPFAVRKPSDGKSTASTAVPLSLVRPRGIQYWEDPFAFVNELDRQFEQMRHNMEALVLPTAWGAGSPAMNALSGLDTATSLAARVDLKDTGKEFVVEAELPGFTKADVDVQITEQGISISAERRSSDGNQAEASGYLAHERAYTSLARIVTFPEGINAEAATAHLKDGLLTVKAPKLKPTAQVKPKKLKLD